MAEFVLNEISSDDDMVNEEQIQYTYIEPEIMPMMEEMGDEIEHHNYGMVDREEHERVQDHVEELSSRNWDLAFKCKEYERDLRILNRSMTTQVRDKLRFWKEVAVVCKQKAKIKIKHLFRCSTENDVVCYTIPQYRWMLEARYSSLEVNPE